MTWAALASEGFRAELEEEIAHHSLPVKMQAGDVFLFEGEPRELAWARVRWFGAEELSITSISDGAKKLRALAKKWRYFSGAHHRRGTLLSEQLRPLKLPELEFPSAFPRQEAGAFTLLAPDRVLYATSFDRPDSLGEVLFREDKSAPSRAYLKLWEALTLFGEKPAPGDRCLDLGSHPGGWTWVIARLGATVLAVDRQPLAAEVAAMPGVEFKAGDAFQLTPEKTGEVDWLFSDVICYPEKLLEFVQLWIASGKAGRMLCTIKMQGGPDPAVIARFQELGRVMHLHHNKHELTWFYSR